MKNLSKIKLKTEKRSAVISRISNQTSRYHSELICRIDFRDGRWTFIDPTMDNYESKWAYIVRNARVGDTLEDLQLDPKDPNIYSGDSQPILRPADPTPAQRADTMGIRVLDRISSQDPAEVSGLSEPQVITLSDDQVFGVSEQLIQGTDPVNITVVPGGKGLEIYGPNIWLVLARASRYQ